MGSRKILSRRKGDSRIVSFCVVTQFQTSHTRHSVFWPLKIKMAKEMVQRQSLHATVNNMGPLYAKMQVSICLVLCGPTAH